MTEWNPGSVTDWKVCWFSQKPQKWLRPQEVVQRNNDWRSPVFIVLYCMTNSGVCVSFCWNVLKVCGLSFLSMSEHKKSPYANWIVPPGVFRNVVHHGVFAVSEPAQGQVFFLKLKKHLIFSCIKMHLTLSLFAEKKRTAKKMTCMHISAVRWSRLSKDRQRPTNIHCTLTATTENSWSSKTLEAKGNWACFSLFSCCFSQHSLSTQQLTQPCVFRDNLHSTGLVYMKGWDNPAVKAVYGLIAWGRSQRRSPDPDLHHPTQNRSTRGRAKCRRVFG